MSDIFIGLGANGERQVLNLGRANRHGLIAGATGTGKTVTLQGLAESFSAEGVPVFVADVKGDLSGIAMPGSPAFKHADKLEARAKELGMDDYAYSDNPAIFWDLYGEQGHPIRTTISEMGPLLLSRLMGLTEAQEGVLNIAFEYAEDNNLLLLDLKDLRKLLAHMSEKEIRDELSKDYGNIAETFRPGHADYTYTQKYGFRDHRGGGGRKGKWRLHGRGTGAPDPRQPGRSRGRCCLIPVPVLFAVRLLSGCLFEPGCP